VGARNILIAIGALLLAPEAGTAAAVLPIHAHRDRITIIHALEAHAHLLSRPPRLCFRLPDAGPEAILVVQRPGALRQGERLLRAADVEGSVEVRTLDQYEHEIEVLAEFITTEAPPMPRPALHASLRSPAGHIECVKASIEVAPQESVTPEELAWARTEIAHYGSDLVTFNYGSRGVLAFSG
jgi:hypothetical protein